MDSQIPTGLDYMENYQKFLRAMDTLVEPKDIKVGETPSKIVLHEDDMKLLHYIPTQKELYTTPVLIVYALVNRYYILDLQPDKSFVKKMIDDGLDVYMVDWGYPSGADRYLTLEDYIEGYMDDAVEKVRELTGQDKITLMGVCQGGTFSVIYASLHPDKIKNLVTVVTPVDFDTDKGLLHVWAKALDADKIVDLYLRGRSTVALARLFRVDRQTIVRRLRSLETARRTMSEVQQLVNAKRPAEERQRIAGAAHDAVRGMRRTPKDLAARARSKEGVPPKKGSYEHRLRQMLAEQGIVTIPQQAIGPYNCDLGAAPVAVEVFGGDWHWTGRHRARLPQRTHHILDSGWHCLVIHVTRKHPLTEATAEYVSTYVKRARRNPAAIREYRMIRSAGQTVAVFRFDGNNIPDILTLVPPQRRTRRLD